MILTDPDETPSRSVALIGQVSDCRIRSAEYFDGYVDCLRQHMRHSHRWGGSRALLAVAVVVGVLALIGEFPDGWL